MICATSRSTIDPRAGVVWGVTAWAASGGGPGTGWQLAAHKGGRSCSVPMRVVNSMETRKARRGAPLRPPSKLRTDVSRRRGAPPGRARSTRAGLGPAQSPAPLAPTCSETVTFHLKSGACPGERWSCRSARQRRQARGVANCRSGGCLRLPAQAVAPFAASMTLGLGEQCALAGLQLDRGYILSYVESKVKGSGPGRVVLFWPGGKRPGARAGALDRSAPSSARAFLEQPARFAPAALRPLVGPSARAASTRIRRV